MTMPPGRATGQPTEFSLLVQVYQGLQDPPLEGEQQSLDEDMPLDVDRLLLEGHQPRRGLGDHTAKSAGNLATSTVTAHLSGRQLR